MNPLRDLSQALVMPFKALFVVGLCAVINAMTYSGYWWFKWVALGMGIATVVALAKGARTMAVIALIAFAGWWIYRRYGASARQTFDDWARRHTPAAADVWRRLRSLPATR
jgi:hypothetical protein